jgi:ribosomal peptide maturation radical SAM protein 1
VSGTLPNLGDTLRLKLLNATFGLAHSEVERRRGVDRLRGARSNSRERDGDAADAAQLDRALRAHITGLADAELDGLHRKLARNLLREVDRLMATHGSPPGKRPELERLALRPPWRHAERAPSSVGLISMPWMSPALPSIQLATLASALSEEGIESDVHELYVDYSVRIGLNLASHLGNLLGYLPEWVFSRHYYGPEHGNDLPEMIEARPLAEIPWSEVTILEALEPVTREYLDDMLAETDWSRYDVLGFSLTISQLGASMALARRIKLENPSVRIVFGGSQCAGPMGRAILRICPYVDVVVHIEGELVLPELVRRLREGRSLHGLPGTSFRRDGELVYNTDTDLYRPGPEKLPVDYDSYFRRLIRLGVVEKMNPWIPFESSRGCWYGQKVQCTFCGLHEIMKFRAWDADVVLAELERLYARYGVGRFYSVDLIMPREYLRTLLPEIVRREHDWMFFYEMKANLRRGELEMMAAAGVRWIQPGIESLDRNLLQLMKKGVTPAQNILLLKWSGELGIFCGWNLLYGLPGENDDSYSRMAELIPKLSHLQPPSGGGRFQLHRFSPYFDHPEQYRIRWTGAHPMFAYAFPVPKEDLDELVYLHEFAFESDANGPADSTPVEAVVRAWRRAHRDGARLEITEQPDGSSRISDARDVGRAPVEYRLSRAETDLYLYLDRNLTLRALVRDFEHDHAASFEALGGERGIHAGIERWVRDDLVVEIDDKVLGLALETARMTANRAGPANDGESIPYLETFAERVAASTPREVLT